MISQMQDVGYDNRNTMPGLATFTFLIIIYFVRIFTVVSIMILCKLLGGRFYLNELNDYVSQKFSFNPVL